MKVHYLKSTDHFFVPVWGRIKNFEIRFNDRDYQVGDFVVLIEQAYDYSNADGQQYGPLRLTGREIFARIHYMTNFEQKSGYVAFSIIELARAQKPFNPGEVELMARMKTADMEIPFRAELR